MNKYSLDKESIKDVVLRPANQSDCGILLQWRNDPRIRKNFFNSESVEEGEHRRWFNALLKDDNKILLIGVLKEKRVGQVRFDIHDKMAKISINVSPKLLGKGLGPYLITKGCAYLFRKTRVKEVIAEIKPENEVSRKSFQYADFTTLYSTPQKIIMKFERG